MELVLRVLQVFLALGLIGVVLLQRSEGGGLGIGSSGGMGSFMSVRGTANLLTRVTAILAGLFMAVCLILALLAKPATAPKSIFDTQAPTPAPLTQAPAPGAPVETSAPPVAPAPAVTTPIETPSAPVAPASTDLAPPPPPSATAPAAEAPAPAAEAPAKAPKSKKAPKTGAAPKSGQ